MSEDQQKIPSDSTTSPGPFTLYITPETVVSDGVYGFLKGFITGAAWGVVTPFHPIVSPWLIPPTEVTSTLRLVFRYKLPTVGVAMMSNGLFLGGITGTFNLSSSALMYARRKDDIWNTLFSIGVTSGIYIPIFTNNSRLRIHNRIIGGFLAGSILYSCVT
mmetsp:Transcript_24180/g.34647  ORF Transcript_24180/g.34647 Transcript_24180/m.34647 type:complete len:161 (+) Transcript_24180:3-485(+)